MSLKKLEKNEIASLLDSIRAEYCDSCVLKNYSKEQVYFWAFSSLDSSFIDLLYRSLQERKNYLDVDFPAIRNAIREELVLFRNNPSGNLNINSFNNCLNDIQTKTIMDLCEFNIIRNRLETAYLGDVDLFYDAATKQMQVTDESNSAALARYEDAEKYSYNKDSFEKNGADYLVSYIVGAKEAIVYNYCLGNLTKAELLLQKYIPSDHIPILDEHNFKFYEKGIQKLIDFVKEDYNAKMEVSQNYKFVEFEINDYKIIYCCLMALCINSMKFCFTECVEKNIIPNPAVIWKKKALINFIAHFSLLSEDKIVYIIDNFLVFRSNFQFNNEREYLAIYHPILDFDDTYIISCSLTLISRAQRKLIWQINKEAKTNKVYEKAISEMAHEKEKLMINEINTFLKQTRCDIRRNVRFHGVQTKNAEVEIDISIYDKKSRILLLMECKDLLPIDNEIERSNQDKKLKEFSKDRAQKSVFIENNLVKYMKDVHRKVEIPNKVISLIVSNHYGGSCTESTPVKIVSKATLFKVLKNSSFNLHKALETISAGDIMPTQIQKIHKICSFNGYTLECNIVDTRLIQ